MNDKNIDDIIDQALKCNIRVELDWDEVRDERVYRVYGFSKSDSVNIFLNRNQEEIEVHARYDEVTTITDFKDLAYIALDWFRRYQDREPFTQPDSAWEQVFFNLGWIEVQTDTTRKIRIK